MIMKKMTGIFDRTARIVPCKRLFILHVACLAVASSAWAVGFRLPNQDPQAIARGNAFAATADDTAAIYYNPAGITQLQGQNATVGLYFLSTDVSYTSPTGAHAETKDDFVPVPQIYYVFSPTNLPLSFGLGVYAPYGLKLDWGNSNPFNTLAEYGKLLYLCINPVVAWKISDTLSVAVGPTINYSEVTFKKAIGGMPGDQFRFNGTDTKPGFNAGVRWQPIEQLAFGVNYRYTTTLDYHGTSEEFPYAPKTSTSASITFPQFVVVGASYRPNPKWNLEVDVDWTDWDAVNSTTFHGTASGDIVNVFDYRSSFMYEFGVTRQLGKGYSLSGGFFYSENSSPDKSFNPLIPDSDLYLGSIGVAHRGKHWDWALAYQVGYNPSRVITGNEPTPPSLAGQTADGTYKSFNNAINVSVTLKF
jgi:long-chain fatty acid transport protein